MHHFFEAITNTSGDSLIGYFARVVNPETLAGVTLAADENGTPIFSVSGVENMAKTDDFGNLNFYVAPGTYHLDIFAPDAVTFRLRISNVAMNSSQGVPGDQGEPGPTGPANNSYTSITALRASPTSNQSAILTAPNIAGIFMWNEEADLSAEVATDPMHRFWIPPTGQTGSAGAWVRQDSGAVNILWFDAVGDEATDNASAFEAAQLVADKLVRPITGPGGAWFLTSRIVHARTGIVDSGGRLQIGALPGTQAYWAEILPGDSEVRRPIVRIGWKFSDNPIPCSVPLTVEVRGLAIRTALRSGDPTTCLFLGDGILLDESAFNMTLDTCKVTFCFKGLVFAGRNGHLSMRNSDISNCWYNRYFERQTGDFRFYDNTITGALFASSGSHSTNKESGIATGGFVGILDIGTHGGFAPYDFYQPSAGTGTVGMLGYRGINSSAEQIGNSFYHGGKSTDGGVTRNTSNVDLMDPSMGWTNPVDTGNYNAYTIIGDANFPVREPVRLTYVSGGPVKISGFGLTRGTLSGVNAHMIIDNLVNWVRDEFDPGGVIVTGDGIDRVIGMRQNFTAYTAVAGFTANTGSEYAIGNFGASGDGDLRRAMPGDTDPTKNWTFSYNASANNPTAGVATITVKKYFNGVFSANERTFRVPPGNQDISYSNIVGVPDRNGDRAVSFKVTTDVSAVVFAAGQSSLAVVQNGVF